MHISDPIANLLTSIRNAVRVSHKDVTVSYSTLKENIARVIHEEGYLVRVSAEGDGVRKQLRLTLKYTADGRSVLSDLQRVSKPSRRVYVKNTDIHKVRNGLGIAVISTPKGVMTDEQARQQHVGGEVICEVW